PLVARNAHLNLNRLGARIVDYVPDMYGETDSPLHRGTGTDRLIVSWPLDDDPEAGRGPGSGDDFGPGPDAAPGRDAPDAVPVVNPWPESGASGPRLDDLPSDAPLVAIQIPRDILAIQQASLEEASSWRRSTRAAFLALGERGYGVVGFERTERGPCRYLLAPAAARPGDASAALAPPDDASPPPALRRSTSPSPGPGGPATLPPTSRPPASSNGEPTS
ncbi:MAG TPA: hypothetical protein VK858_18575, partial [Longimicrobiales bacterium]|nr:hypothetical protein [Longimicrobiales bacterium]